VAELRRTHFPKNDVITDELVEEARLMVGMPVRTEGWNREASPDSVRHYSWGIGDDNPLYCDTAYGRATVWGSALAPPTFLYTISDGGICPGLGGLQPMYNEGRWKFDRPIRVGEVLTATAKLIDVKDINGKGSHTGRFLVQVGLTEYWDATGQRVASQQSGIARLMRRGTPGALNFEQRKETTWTEPELETVGAQVLAEVRRGPEVRPWSSVQVGDETPQVVKEVNLMTMLAYYASCPGSPGYKSAEMQWKYRWLARNEPDKLPSQFDPSYFGAFTIPSAGHTDAEVAHAIGLPGRYDNGPQRIGWAAHLVTNWMGDAGELRELNFRMSLPEIYGDVIYFRGKVVSKRVDDGRHLVDISFVSVNHLGEHTGRGSAVVSLPHHG
jgi:acyl dehydratase